jgi:E3 ubiquitin-protein ligase synoviolin
MDQQPYPGPPTLFHVRMHTLFFLLWATDFLMFVLAVENTLVNGVGGMVLFASEVRCFYIFKSTSFRTNKCLLPQYAILMASILNSISKYLLSWYDIRRAGQRGGENAPQWESKSMWIFYIELTTGNALFPFMFIHLVTLTLQTSSN